MVIADRMIVALTLLAALGGGLMAGLFFAFSVSVMTALGRRPATEGIAAMQAINVVILNPVFFAAFFGTAMACGLVVIVALLQWGNPGAVYLLVGALLYLVGGIWVTIAFNVPRNQALARVEARDPSSASLWADYLSTWAAWNHVRTVACLAAAAFLTVALYVQ